MSDKKPKGPGGRPTKYRDDMPDRLIKFFNIPEIKKQGGKVVAEEYPMVIDFCLQEDISNDTFFRWVKEHKAFSDAYSKVKKIQEKFLVKNSIQNRYNPYFSQFVLMNNHGWVKSEKVEQTSKVEINIDDDESKL